MRTVFLFIFLFFAFSDCISGAVVSAASSEYSGKRMHFYHHADPITQASETGFLLQFDNKGNATTNVAVKSTTCFYCDFGIYRGSVFIEPGKNIKINLPPLREKSFADQKNPYFEPVYFWFTVAEEENLNNLISSFNNQINQLTNKYFNQLYIRNSKAAFDSIAGQINRYFPDKNIEAFEVYKALSLKLLEADALRLKTEQYASVIGDIPLAQWQNPAFESIFEKAFENRLSFATHKVDGNELKKAVNNSDLSFVKSYVAEKFHLKGDFVQLVTLKLLYDGYYSGNFSKSAIEKMMQLAVTSEMNNAAITNTAKNILTKFLFLKKGTEAPEVCLKSFKNNELCTAGNHGKYKYIVFADVDMAVCREQLKYLSAIDKKFGKYLEIYVIFRNADMSDIKTFVVDKQVPGTILIDSSGDAAHIYKIRSFPAAFLLNENHFVQIEAAKTPLNGFEQQFGLFLRNELFQRQRNQSR